MTLLIGFAVIATELERPFLLLQMALLSPNPSSPIWWMGTLYGIYMVLIAVELYFLFVEDHHKARIAGVLSVVAAVSAHSNLGAAFGLSHARAYWYGPLLPVYFIASALVCGAALLILIVYFSDYFTSARRATLKELLRAIDKAADTAVAHAHFAEHEAATEAAEALRVALDTAEREMSRRFLEISTARGTLPGIALRGYVAPSPIRRRRPRCPRDPCTPPQ